MTDVRCFCGRRVARVERLGPGWLAVSDVDIIAGPDRWAKWRQASGGSRRRPNAVTASSGPVAVEVDGSVSVFCARHGELAVTGAELDQAVRHGRRVHHLTRSNG